MKFNYYELTLLRLHSLISSFVVFAQVLPFEDNLCLNEVCPEYTTCSSDVKVGDAVPFITSDTMLFRPVHPRYHFRCSCPVGFTGKVSDNHSGGSRSGMRSPSSPPTPCSSVPSTPGTTSGAAVLSGLQVRLAVITVRGQGRGRGAFHHIRHHALPPRPSQVPLPVQLSCRVYR